MATEDTPGSNPRNNDKLATGCWAEHSDGSLIFVEGTENGEVVFSTFDMAQTPPVEYRAMLKEDAFANSFSCNPSDMSKSVFKGSKTGDKNPDRWTWHDKTPFPWERVMKAGFREGYKLPSRDHILAEAEAIERSAASRVRDALHLKAMPIQNREHLTDQIRDAMSNVADVIAKALSGMRN